MSTTDTLLQDTLNVKKAEFVAKASDHIKQIYQEGLDAVANSGILDKASNVGDKASDFTLPNATSQSVTLSELLKIGPVVLTWYRGGWCPYCNLTLQRLQQELPAIKAAGAQLLALTPELPDNSLNTSQKHALDFEVLSDVGNAVARAYDLVFSLTPEVAESYQNAFDMHGVNGDESDELPLAATYVIDQTGTITYAFLDFDYRNRAEPKDILAALQQLKAS